MSALRRRAPTPRWRVALAVLSLTSAVGVSVVYLPQVLILDVASSFGIPTATAGSASIAAQFGYALGILLLVPLSDRLRTGRQVAVQLVVLGLLLLAIAASPTAAVLTVGFAAVGLVAGVAQIIVPAVGRLVPPAHRATAVGVLVGSIGVGIFGGRTVAGALVTAVGWRGVLVLFAVAALAVAPAAWSALRSDLPSAVRPGDLRRLPFETLALLRNRSIAQAAVLQFFCFAAFNASWSATVLDLTTGRFHWSREAAGAFAIIGLVAAVATPAAGRLVDGLGATRVAVPALGLLSASVLAGDFVPASTWLYGTAMLGVALANQAMQTANQHTVVQAAVGGAGRSNAAFMVVVFLGGGLGAFVGPAAFALGGIVAVGAAAGALTLCAWLVLVVSRRSPAQQHFVTLRGRSRVRR